MTTRIRKPPPPFRRVTVVATEPVSPYMTRVIVSGASLAGFVVDEPAASVRLLLPTDALLTIPEWAGNEFLLPDGDRALIRTLTPRRFDPQKLELALDIVHHDGGIASEWAASASPGNEVAVSGPGRGYTIDPDASAFVLVGDETAIPAICQLLEHLPDVPITVHIEIRHAEASVDLHRAVNLHWHVLSHGALHGDSVVPLLERMDLRDEVRVWAAGEAQAMHRLRKVLFTERGLPRNAATVRGYWKHRSA
jgi:NADPH-dependent ferric siderophore reductase